ncbi:Acyl-coenzyme A thioesterase PaaI, contains HGG motif [Monaibacterium marinum]|uniref:Acyl-coenzyme A thioesterase PaaI, contains HGG motif n=1 Tax=Pontivivens marinum TaxID=1690039 RepID=A0A2C9CQ05_9RHOB|nr:PaaI family thioesterase [Monaibacterium marinum]SOH93436.1 Acyl-coenzyme A thioesterase PaaI, contains HGG motif [Monaibacterium marinum]
MSRGRNEPVQEVKARRDAALARLTKSVPYMQFLGISFDRRGDELTAVLSYSDHLIGNPMLPALHGGAIGAFLESAALVEVMWHQVWDRMEASGPEADAIENGDFPDWPKVIDITVDYLRSGLPRDAYARTTITRAGRRYASVRVEAWQDNRERPFAEAMVHLLMPQDR